MNLIKYENGYKNIWDQFVINSKNGHFFFQRDYMQYHNDRFEDHSLMFFDKKNKLLAILPANIKENVLYSHGGLTFGGFLVNSNMKVEIMLNIFEILQEYLKNINVSKVIYKCIPYIYHSLPSEEDKYALFVNDAKLIRRDVTSTIDLENRVKYQEQRKRAVKKANKFELEFEQSDDFFAYWKILEEALLLQHSTKPIHTVDEIINLAKLFPNNIKLFVAKKDENILAGTLIFENEKIIHTQYLANSIEGRVMGALDYVIDKLINDVYANKKYFDFGISNENAGKYLNIGLIAQKEGFGGRAVSHEFYELEIK